MTDQIRRVPPDTGRIVEGLRDTGYTLNAAIADIVDNSITANATAVNISLQLDGQRNVLIRVSDNGHGMDVAGLENAMRYGSAVREERNSLSRFGLGLKTASTSFCRRLTVVSVPTGGEDVVAAAWDLDELAEQDDWVLRIGTADSATRDSYLDEMDSLAQVSGMDSQPRNRRHVGQSGPPPEDEVGQRRCRPRQGQGRTRGQSP